MSVINRLLSLVGIEQPEIDAEYEDMMDEELISNPIREDLRKGGKEKIVNINTTAQLKLVVMQPENFDQARDIADHLKTKKPVVINLEGLERDVAKKIIDFLSGAVYALDGNIQKVSSGIFLIAPYNVGIMGDVKDELYKKVSFPWN